VGRENKAEGETEQTPAGSWASHPRCSSRGTLAPWPQVSVFLRRTNL
jgi:hypothetical protein